MSGKSTLSIFDQAFSNLAQPVYNPSKYAEEESWGDLESEVTYKEEVLNKPRASSPAEPVFRPPPKPSKVAQKYFNVTKPPPEKPVEKPKEDIQKYVDAKISELNSVIGRFKRESEQLKRANILLDEQQRNFLKEQQEHQKLISETRSNFQHTVEAELEEFRKKAKVRERNQKVLSTLPNKKEREEKEALKNMIAKAIEETRAKESRFKLNKERLSKLVAEARDTMNERRSQLQKIKDIYGLSSHNTPDTNGQKEEYLERNDQREELLQQTDQREDLVEQQEDYSTRHRPKEDFQKTEPICIVPQEYAEPPEYTEPIQVVSQQTYSDGTLVKLYATSHKEILYPSGTKHEVYPNGYSVIFHTNNDVKQTFPDGKTVYFYAETNTTHTRLPNGTEIIRFGNGQIEKHLPGGAKKVKYLDGTVKYIKVDGEEETIYPDSTREVIDSQGERSICHPGGHREVTKVNGEKYRVFFN